jgi:Zn-dependent M28 family amino/carboxypeptidase
MLVCLRVLSTLAAITLAAQAGKVPPSTSRTDFSGVEAFSYTRRAVSFGERPSGSPAINRLRDWIVSELKASGGQISLDSFTGQTPKGPIPMTNIIVKFPGNSGKAVVLTGHYDTKNIAMTHFVGANDAGSSTGVLLELSKSFAHLKHSDDLYLVFFDGEEAVEQWTDSDSRYGSQHLVSKWGADGTLSRIKALINIDMVGDKDLDVLNDENSSQSLRNMVFDVASQLGDGKYFLKQPAGIDDDHMPFVNAGVNAIDLIDFDFGPHNSYWHTAQDTMDKLSPHSLQIVGEVVVGVVKRLEAVT